MTEYEYVQYEREHVNAGLKDYADRGWTVHTINRNRNASIVDILFEKKYPLVNTGPR